MADTRSERQERQEKTEPPRGLLSRRRGFGELFPSTEELFWMNPFSLMRRMTDEMSRAFAQSGTGLGSQMTWSPAIEVAQKEGKLEVSAELPGLKPEEVKITVDDDMLIVEGERTERKEEGGIGGVRRSEIRYGRFYRAIPLPESAQIDQSQARFDNGVLRIEVPLSEQASQRRQIPIAGTTGEAAGKAEPGKTESGGKRAA